MTTFSFKEYFAEKTDKELFNEYLDLNNSINKVGCFGSKDLILFEKIANELANRGYEIEIELGEPKLSKKGQEI